MAEPNSLVSISRSGAGLLGTATAGPSGLWMFNAGYLLEGVHAFLATATLNGKTSDPSPTFLVTIDNTAPAVTLDAPMTTFDLTPEVRVTASDLFGLPNDSADANFQLFVDVDRDQNDVFSGTELGYSTTSLHDGHAVIEVSPSAGQLPLVVGTWKMRADSATWPAIPATRRISGASALRAP